MRQLPTSTLLTCALLFGCSSDITLPDEMRGTAGAPTTAGGPSGGAGVGGVTIGGAGSGTGGASPRAGSAGGPAAGESSGGGAGGSGGSSIAGGGGGAGAGAGGGGAGGGGAGGSGAGAGGSGAGGSDGGYGPAAGPCKILPLGDSITDGLTTAGGYRIRLFELAAAAGKNITFVGGSMNGPQMVANSPFPRAHEGHSGWTISQIDGIVPKPALDVHPHLILLHIGTNDMSSMGSQAPGRLEALIDQILAAEPNALLVVATIIPLPFAANAVTTYNAAIPTIVEERAQEGKHVILVDQFKGYPDGELPDNVHPSPEGYAYMAENWYAAISKYLR